MAERDEQLGAMVKAVGSARNLMPSAFALAADPGADPKARWKAFDELYDYIVGEMQRVDRPHRPRPIKAEGLTPERIAELSERGMRMQVAHALLMLAYGNSEEMRSAVLYQIEELVPTNPDPDTWRPPFTLQDHVILYKCTGTAFDEFPEEMACFYKAESEPLARRKLAFQRLYTCIGGTWRDFSAFARALSPEHRQAQVVLALMCHIPRDRWTTEDLQELRRELLPVEEPDWDALDREVGPPK
jgi:hypothetical protein